MNEKEREGWVLDRDKTERELASLRKRLTEQGDLLEKLGRDVSRYPENTVIANKKASDPALLVDRKVHDISEVASAFNAEGLRLALNKLRELSDRKAELDRKLNPGN